MYSEVMKREIQQRLTWIELYELTNDLVRYVDVTKRPQHSPNTKLTEDIEILIFGLT